MSDRHEHNPITYRPARDTRGWLDDIAAREGRPVRAVIGEAVERARVVDEAGLAAFDREVTRRMAEFFRARAEGRDGAEEAAAFDAADAAYRHAIRQWQPPCRPS